jgi:thioredoxin 1
MNYFYITDSSTEQIALNENKAIICFSATWCGPCKKIKPLYHEIAENNKDINFYEVDIDDREELVTKFNIKSIPTFILLKEGNKINELVGSNINELSTLIKNHLQ